MNPFKLALLIGSLPFLAIPLSGVQVGDAFSQVIAEKGDPSSRLAAGASVILNYPDVSIQLRDGRVVSIRVVRKTVFVPVAADSPAPKPRPVPRPVVASGIDSAQWSTDYPAALAQAKETNRKVFLLFTGSDWCPWCKKLEAEILSTPEFTQYADSHLILVKFDFLKYTQQPQALMDQNVMLSRKYGIKGYPTVVMLDSSGQPLAQLGYRPGGPNPFIGALSKL